ncbi:MAG: hypothetical protein J2O46_01820 [Nocardioides sp.]|nr:hypothetical protein [Nocardioides sp.]
MAISSMLRSRSYAVGTAAGVVLAVVAILTRSPWALGLAAAFVVAGIVVTVVAGLRWASPERPRPRPARTFYFDDEERVREQLVQVEQGNRRTKQRMRSEVVSKGLVVGADFKPLSKLEGSLSRQRTRQYVEDLEETPETRFNLLHGYLTERGLESRPADAEWEPLWPEAFCELVIDTDGTGLQSLLQLPETEQDVLVDYGGQRLQLLFRVREEASISRNLHDLGGHITVLAQSKSSPGQSPVKLRVFAAYRSPEAH